MNILNKELKGEIIFLLILIPTLIMFYFSRQIDIKIQKNHFVKIANISRISYEGKLGETVYFNFYCNGKRIQNKTSCSKITQKRYEEGYNKIFIVIEKGNCNNYSLLQDKDDFIKYNITNKDTMALNTLYP